MSFWERVKFAASAVFAYLLPLIKKIAKLGGKIAIQVAINACKRAEERYSSGEGDLKRAFAAEEIMEDLKRVGKEVTLREAHDLIQVALPHI